MKGGAPRNLRPWPGIQAVPRKGKYIYLRSLYPSLAQVVENGVESALLRVVREPLFSHNLVLAAGPTNNRLTFFSVAQGANTPEGLAMTRNLQNTVQGGQLGTPEVADFYGLSWWAEPNLGSDVLGDLVTRGTCVFEFAGTQQVYRIPLWRLPQACGFTGVGGFAEPPAFTYGDGSADNVFDISTSGFPRRVWSQETWTVTWEWDVPPINTRNILVAMCIEATRYIK